ncbi:MAG: hypothetical protein ACO3MW_07910 [Rhodospirillales bacterium]
MAFRALIKGGIDFDTKGAKQGIQDVEKQTNKLRKGLRSMQGQIGAAFSVGALSAGLRGLINEAEDIGNAAAKVGQSTDLYQAFLREVEIGGGTINAAINTFSELRLKVDAARQGNAAAIASFQALGISIEDLNQDTLPELFDKFAKGLKETKNFSEASKILGSRNLREVNTVLMTIADIGLPAFIEQVRNAGGVIDEEFIAKASDVNRTLSEMGNRFKSFAATVLLALSRPFEYLGTLSVAAQETFEELMRREMTSGDVSTKSMIEFFKQRRAIGKGDLQTTAFQQVKPKPLAPAQDAMAAAFLQKLDASNDKVVKKLENIETQTKRGADATENIDIETGTF